ncbi:MAG: GAF domain-containing sensor histidine kinase [Deltaproteobacteria bacterium]|nr:GAF domain-containing sensor histidine kinase [Deltaproteobacteria bacterium]
MTRQIPENIFLEMGELLNSNLDEASILRTFCNKILSLFDAERVSILAVDPQGKKLTLTAWAGRYPEDFGGISIPIGEGVAGWVAATGESLLVQDAAKDPRFPDPFPGRYRTRSFISVPLKSRGRLLGVLSVTDTSRNDGFSDENLSIIKPLALQVGMGMENLLLKDNIDSVDVGLSALISSIRSLNTDVIDMENGLIPTLIRGVESTLSPQFHIVLMGEMGSNRAWVGRSSKNGLSEVSVMDYSSGFRLYQSLSALPLSSPMPDHPHLRELGIEWDLVLEGKLNLVRNILPPRPNFFGISLGAILDMDLKTIGLLRDFQNIIIRFGGLVMEGIFDRSQIRKLDHLKTELISTVSHELRTPLTSIQGFSELVLRGDGIPDPQRRYLSIINNESQRLNRLINDFLDLARLESGQLNLVKEPMDPVQVVEGAARLLKPQAEAGKAFIRLNCQQNLPLLIADRDRIEQVLVNLVSNAIRHGGPEVHIDITVQKHDGNTVFEVKDDGPGIPEEEHDLIFTRFYRGILGRDDDEEADVDKGTGLGLALTKEIVEQHGGTISMESVPNERTLFRFSLPTRGLMRPQRGIVAWDPGDEGFSIDLAGRLSEGKTVGVLTIHVNPNIPNSEPEVEFSVERLEEIEELITSTLRNCGMDDDFIQSRPQAEFVVLTYASMVDKYAGCLLKAFTGRFGDLYELAIGASISEGMDEKKNGDLLKLSRQACLFVERDRGTGYLKNRRM